MLIVDKASSFAVSYFPVICITNTFIQAWYSKNGKSSTYIFWLYFPRHAEMYQQNLLHHGLITESKVT